MADGGRDRGIEEWLYVGIAGALILYLVIGVVAWAWMIVEGIAAPAAFTTVLSTIAGGLIGILSPIKLGGGRGGGGAGGTT